uniref:Si:dkey-280e21.3 n=1 Tax=Neogobius melanostomus TaxID=47308 RepID=A0A8C6SYY2_9GOBI
MILFLTYTLVINCCVFVPVSQMVIEEVSMLQTQLEIEKSCRENAEALATKLNSENRKLKYLSMSSRPCLDEFLPSISDCIATETEANAMETDGGHDTFSQYQEQVKELRETVNGLLEEKKTLVSQIHDQQRQIQELNAQTQADQAEMTELRETVEQQKKTIKRFNRVSVMAAQEFEEVKEQLDLEQSLRVKAEDFAHEMLVKQKEANRQSMVLMQSCEPSEQLLRALDDLATATKTLEEERRQHHLQVQSLEQQLEQSALRKQLDALQKQLLLLDEEKREAESRLEQEVRRSGELQNRGETSSGTAPCPCPSAPAAPSSSPPPPPPPPPSRLSEGVDDVKVKAVNEMMERIKHGVVLRPVKSQETKVRTSSIIFLTLIYNHDNEKQESAMEELKGILDTVKRSPSRGSQDSASSPQPKKDSELELILRRRRNKAGEAGDEREGQLNHVSSCDSLNSRRTSSDSTGGLVVPSDQTSGTGPAVSPDRRGSGTGPAVSPDRRGSGPGPIVPRRKSADCGGQRRESCGSVSENPVTNGAMHRCSSQFKMSLIMYVFIRGRPNKCSGQVI